MKFSYFLISFLYTCKFHFLCVRGPQRASTLGECSLRRALIEISRAGCHHRHWNCVQVIIFRQHCVLTHHPITQNMNPSFRINVSLCQHNSLFQQHYKTRHWTETNRCWKCFWSSWLKPVTWHEYVWCLSHHNDSPESTCQPCSVRRFQLLARQPYAV